MCIEIFRTAQQRIEISIIRASNLLRYKLSAGFEDTFYLVWRISVMPVNYKIKLFVCKRQVVIVMYLINSDSKRFQALACNRYIGYIALRCTGKGRQRL